MNLHHGLMISPYHPIIRHHALINAYPAFVNPYLIGGIINPLQYNYGNSYFTANPYFMSGINPFMLGMVNPFLIQGLYSSPNPPIALNSYYGRI